MEEFPLERGSVLVQAVERFTQVRCQSPGLNSSGSILVQVIERTVNQQQDLPEPMDNQAVSPLEEIPTSQRSHEFDGDVISLQVFSGTSHCTTASRANLTFSS